MMVRLAEWLALEWRSSAFLPLAKVHTAGTGICKVLIKEVSNLLIHGQLITFP